MSADIFSEDAAASLGSESRTMMLEQNVNQIVALYNSHQFTQAQIPMIRKIHVIQKLGTNYRVKVVDGAPENGLDLYVAMNSGLSEAMLHAVQHMHVQSIHMFVASTAGREAAGIIGMTAPNVHLAAYDIRSHHAHPSFEEYVSFVLGLPRHPSHRDVLNYVLGQKYHPHHAGAVDFVLQHPVHHELLETILQSPHSSSKYDEVRAHILQNPGHRFFMEVVLDEPSHATHAQYAKIVVEKFNHLYHWQYLTSVIKNPKKYESIYGPVTTFVTNNQEHIQYMREVLADARNPQREEVLRFIQDCLPQEMQARVALTVTAEGGGVVPGMSDLSQAFASTSLGDGGIK